MHFSLENDTRLSFGTAATRKERKRRVSIQETRRQDCRAIEPVEYQLRAAGFVAAEAAAVLVARVPLACVPLTG